MTARTATLPFQPMLNRTAAIIALSCVAWGISVPVRAEMSARDKTVIEAAFTRADTNGDNQLSRDEAERLPAISARFDEFDLNKDGTLSFSEFVLAASAAQ
jgi:Ca2+-binding EF-hand superfamily protein